MLEDLPEPCGHRVLVRADLNVPLAAGPSGQMVVEDDFRIRATLPTIHWLVDRGAEVTVCSHLGRPDGRPDPQLTMEPVRRVLQRLAPEAELMENLRFDAGEEANDADFVDRLVAGQDLYVDDAFGASHREHASIVGPPSRLPSAGGRLLAAELEALGTLLDRPTRPFVAVVGGAKVADKLAILCSLVERAEVLVVGGAMAFTFLVALGHDVGESVVELDQVEACRKLLDSGRRVMIPTDVVALGPLSGPEAGASEMESRAGASEMESRAGASEEGSVSDHSGRAQPAGPGEVAVVGRTVPPGWRGMDIGPGTAAEISDEIAGAGTVFWNGPMGMFEDDRFASGTATVAEAVAACAGFTVVGGGDSAYALDRLGLADQIDHVSTGGGASLELLERGDLPGLAALRASLRIAHRA